MPNQVEEEKAKIINKNNKIQKLNIALVCSLIAAVLLTVISFLTKDVVQLTLAIIAFVCYLAFFTVGIIKIRIKKKKQYLLKYQVVEYLLIKKV